MPIGFPTKGPLKGPSKGPLKGPSKGPSPAGGGENASPADGGPAAPAPPLPDLTGVRLRGLRALDDPCLSAAADSVLLHPDELAETWYSSGAQGGRREVPGGHQP